jgi:hypothetical protein
VTGRRWAASGAAEHVAERSPTAAHFHNGQLGGLLRLLSLEDHDLRRFLAVWYVKHLEHAGEAPAARAIPDVSLENLPHGSPELNQCTRCQSKAKSPYGRDITLSKQDVSDSMEDK